MTYSTSLEATDSESPVQEYHKLEANAYSCYRKKRYSSLEKEAKLIQAVARRNYYRNIENGLGETRMYIYSCSVCSGYHMTRHAEASTLARQRGNQDRVIAEINLGITNGRR